MLIGEKINRTSLSPENQAATTEEMVTCQCRKKKDGKGIIRFG